MQFKIGDRVKFLNENGGGIVTKIVGSKIVHVMIEDGFEIPTLTSDIIKTGIPEERGSNFFEEKFDVKVEDEKLREAEAEADQRISPISKFSSATAPLPGIYLAFVPQDQKWLITGLMDIFLINNTDNDALYSLFVKDSEKKNYSGADYDLIPAWSMINIETIERDNIEKWSAGVIQVLLHRDETEKVLLPVNSEYNVKPTRFYKENNYRESSFFQGKAIVLTIAEVAELIPQDNVPEKKDKDNDQNKEQGASKIKTPKTRDNEIIDKHRIQDKKSSSFFKIAEVDLHIHELVDDYSKMNADEILKHQLSYFTRCLESAINSKYSKVVFIHGIGNGTLRTSIIEKLKEYDFLRYDDAIFSRYGKGAVEVKFFYGQQG